MATLTIRIRPMESKTELLRRKRSFFSRITYPLYRARMQKFLPEQRPASTERRLCGGGRR